MRAMVRMLPMGLFVVAAIATQMTVSALGKPFYLTALTMSVYYAIVAMGLCLVMGYAGQVSMGHGAFFAIGGYTSAVLTTADCSRWAGGAFGFLQRARLVVSGENFEGMPIQTLSPWAACVVAIVLTLVVAVLLGYPALRLKGHYLAMATLGFGLIVQKLILGSAFTGATDGLSGVPEWRLPLGLTISGKSSLRVENYYLACGLAAGVMLVLSNLIHSRVGRALQAIHDRELAASAMGIDTGACKLKAFVLSALLAAIAGVCFAHYTGSIGPSEAGPMKSVRYLALVAAGGMSNLWMVAFVSIAINFMSLRGLFGSYDHAVFGALLILIVSLAPEGPLRPLRDLAGRCFRRRAPSKGGGHASA